MLLIVAALEAGARFGHCTRRPATWAWPRWWKCIERADLDIALTAWAARRRREQPEPRRRSRSTSRPRARLIDEIPDDVVAVAESGLRSRDDLRRLRDAGYDAFLVGERLVTAADPGQALSELLSCS